MAHGFSAVKEHDLDRFGEVFAAAGLGVVAFDHHGFGGSAGEPRQEVDAVRQLRAYPAVMDWAERQPGVDPDRLGVWGASFSGGYALTLAAREPRVRCVVANAPYCAPVSVEPPAELAELVAKRPNTLIPVATPGNVHGTCALGSPGAYEYFTEVEAPAWRNEVTLRSMMQFFTYAPIDLAFHITVPLLVIRATEDLLTPREPVRLAAAAAQGATKFLEVPGGHFDVYRAQFETTSAAARDWFVTHLQG